MISFNLKYNKTSEVISAPVSLHHHTLNILYKLLSKNKTEQEFRKLTDISCFQATSAENSAVGFSDNKKKSYRLLAINKDIKLSISIFDFTCLVV